MTGSSFVFCSVTSGRGQTERGGGATVVVYTVVAVIITVLIPRNYMAVTLLITVL